MSASPQIQVLAAKPQLKEVTHKVSIGVFAYNEEENIGRLLSNLSEQSFPETFRLEEILVIASGCTDRTEEIVRIHMGRNSNLRLLRQPTRKGKPAAVNLFLQEARGDILVMESADTLPSPKTIQQLLEPFRDNMVGGVSSYPVPIEDDVRPLASGIVQLIWTDLNHEFAIRGAVRLSGELFAIRTGIVVRVPESVVHEDAYIERVIALGGHKLVYVPSAKVRMRGPRHISELIAQRRKNLSGHIQLRQYLGVIEPTARPFEVLKVLIGVAPRVMRESIIRFLLIPFGVLVETVAYTLAVKDYREGKLPSGLRNYYLKTTKNLAGQ